MSQDKKPVLKYPHFDNLLYNVMKNRHFGVELNNMNNNMNLSKKKQRTFSFSKFPVKLNEKVGLHLKIDHYFHFAYLKSKACRIWRTVKQFETKPRTKSFPSNLWLHQGVKVWGECSNLELLAMYFFPLKSHIFTLYLTVFEKTSLV